MLYKLSMQLKPVVLIYTTSGSSFAGGICQINGLIHHTRLYDEESRNLSRSQSVIEFSIGRVVFICGHCEHGRLEDFIVCSNYLSFHLPHRISPRNSCLPVQSSVNHISKPFLLFIISATGHVAGYFRLPFDVI